jgi:ferredoxin-NADP reductase/MOSC domain-containing protein YiiM/ferredoxin
MARLLSVNVGLPRDIEWKGRTVHTGIWKEPLKRRCRAARLNLDGDGQGDLGGHGGEHRAVFVYQTESARFWKEQLKWLDVVYGQFGENFTVEGMPDNDVCIGDRYRIGDALFEVTQPRVTCYRVGIRTNEPRMAALLTSSGRPGFYFRVLKEGEVGAGDDIVKVDEAAERMTITEINALLYSPHHPRDRLERALRIDALSLGWKHSFEALLSSAVTGKTKGKTGGNAGLTPASAANPAAPGFHPLTVVSIVVESVDVISYTLQRADYLPLPMAKPGQYVVLRLQQGDGKPPLYRSYSLSNGPSALEYRISVKFEEGRAATTYLRDRVRVGDVIDVSDPRGSFVLLPGASPVVMLSAGIGATPVLAMLNTLSSQRSTRQVWWLHAARDGQHHPFDAEARQLATALADCRHYICFSKPDAAHDRQGVQYTETGHFSQATLVGAGIPTDAQVYLCGPSRFMNDMKAALTNLGFAKRQVHTEFFNGLESMNPGIVGDVIRAPHLPENDSAAGPLVSFARSRIDVHWDGAAYPSILELAEACDVPVRWACRTGVCHNCESGLISGSVTYSPEPLDLPANGNLLICCSQPVGDTVTDL